MNHKRKGPKSTRSGCLLCKPHKRQGVDSPRINERRARIGETEQMASIESDPCPWDTDETSEARLCDAAPQHPYPAKARSTHRAALWYIG